MESLAEIEQDASMSEHVKELKKQIKEIASKLGDIEKDKKQENQKNKNKLSSYYA